MLSRIEKQLKRRFAIGSQVSEHSIIQDFTKQVGLPWGRLRGGEGAGGLLVAARGPVPTHPALVFSSSADRLSLVPGLFHNSSPWDCFSLGQGAFSVL